MLPTFIRPAGEHHTSLSKFCDNFIFAVRKAVLSLPEPSIRVYKTVVYFVIFFGKPLGPVARSMVSVNQRLIP